MKIPKTTFILILSLFIYEMGLGQQSNINETITKIKAIHREYRIVEKTFSDYIFAPDTTISNNQIFSYYFSSSNRYRINAFGSREDISDINVSVYSFENSKSQLIVRDAITSTDVSVNFNPSRSGTYYIVVRGVLKTGIEAAYFNVIIDRD